MTAEATLYCSFCGKSQHEVHKLIAGPTVHICDECVDLCKEIVDESHKITIRVPSDPVPRLEEIVKALGNAIDVEDDVKKALSLILQIHCQRMAAASLDHDQVAALPPLHGLLIGRSLERIDLARELKQKLPIPFVIMDALTLVVIQDETDVRGAIAYELLQAADFNLSRAEHGIVLIDDLDQFGQHAMGLSDNAKISIERVQQSLVDLMKGLVVDAAIESGMHLDFDMSGVTFICSGTFFGLARRKEAGEREGGRKQDPGRLAETTAKVLVEHGMLPDLVDSLSVLITLTVDNGPE